MSWLKGISAVLTVVTVLCVVPSCTKQKQQTPQLLEALLCEFKMEEQCYIYGRSDPRKKGRDLLLLYGEAYASYEMAFFEDYALALSKKDGGFEIQILLVRHESQIEEGKRFLRARINVLLQADVERYLGEDFKKYLSSVRIYQRGRYLFLLATEDNERAISIIADFF